MDILQICFRTIISYVVLVISLRVMGKREIGQLNLFDLIILLSIADIMIIGIENYQDNWLNSLVPVIMLTVLQKIVAFLLLKFTKIRNLIDGEISIIVVDGIVNIDEMKKSAYNMEDLLLQLRSKDIYNIEDVAYAFLETNGSLSVFKKKSSKIYPIPVIISGKINKKILSLYDIKEDFIRNELGKNHLLIKNIQCAYYDKSGLIITKTVKNYFLKKK